MRNAFNITYKYRTYKTVILFHLQADSIKSGSVSGLTERQYLSNVGAPLGHGTQLFKIPSEHKILQRWE